MVIRTYFWHARRMGLLKPLAGIVGLKKDLYFRHGNAGDTFNRDLLGRTYGCRVKNTSDAPRLLCTGSIAHQAKAGDVLCGVGVKALDHLPRVSPPGSIFLRGLRGPKTLEAFRDAGHDVSGVRFLMDPGILISSFLGPEALRTVGREIVFIPHYRERDHYAKNPPNGIRVLDIDNPPIRIAREILKAKIVASSSLHGIVFAHSLGRPAVPVKPRTEEPLFKYEDYYAALHVRMPAWLDEPTLDGLAAYSDTPLDIGDAKARISFPPEEELRFLGVIR